MGEPRNPLKREQLLKGVTRSYGTMVLARPILGEMIDYIWVRLIRPNPDIVPLVEGLKSDHRLVLASNTDRIHFPYAVQHFGGLQHFNRYFLSYEMGLLKPEPEFFHRVLRDLHVSPVDCVFIDDTVENVAAAASIGIQTLKFDGVQQLGRDRDAVL